ncbi:MAG: PEP-utilizing enzyme [Acidimicrobiales bacterium]|jgi:pyruvate,water dikinase|nr:PEP-utilizing enzyme [Acidimicrobiales bacterium]HJM28267.1 PEP-utilizing enzyme [Acidimicrobiales bacterium]HJM97739.1 PEP-utilizing enzyme [Acidimicrobiales bacterium]
MVIQIFGGFMDDYWFCDWEPSERWPHYTRANAGEVLAPPASPLGQTFTWDNGTIIGWRDGYIRQGYFTEGEMSDFRPEVGGFFGGFFYINLSNVRMQGVRNPAVTIEGLDLAFFGEHPDVPEYVEHPDDVNEELTDGILSHMGWVMSVTEWPEIEEAKEKTKALRKDRPALSSLTPAELVVRARDLQPLLIETYNTHCVAASSSGVAPGILGAVGEAVGDMTVPMRCITGLGDVDSAAPSYFLWDLSRSVSTSEFLTTAFNQGVEGLLGRISEAGNSDAEDFMSSWNEFIFNFGSRGPNEYEIFADSWETNPTIALALLDRIRLQADEENPTDRHAKIAQSRVETIGLVREKLSEIANEELSGQFEAALIAGNIMVFQERTKTNFIRVINEIRVTFEELGKQSETSGHISNHKHIYMLTDDELDSYVSDPASMKETLEERFSTYEQLQELEPPFFIKDGIVPPLNTYKKLGTSIVESAASGDVLTGVAGSPGTVTGTARVILDPTDPFDLEPGDILVAPLTDPSWTPLFMTAGAVIVDVGGQRSHAVIVSRELGLPCVISVTDGTKRIPNGSQIEVNGSTGEVTVI